VKTLASNTGRGFRRGAVTGRSQVRNPASGRWVKRDRSTGRFMDGKANAKPFRGVTRER
jgi:hypothetical protein